MDPLSTQLMFAAKTSQKYDGCLAIGNPTASPYVTVYPFTRDSGFGVKYSDPSSITYSGPFASGGIKFTEDGLGLVYSNDPTGAIGAPAAYGLNFYAWSKTTGFGTRRTYSGSWPPYGPGGVITTKPSEYTDSTYGLYHYVVHAYVDTTYNKSWIQKAAFNRSTAIGYTSQRDTGQLVRHSDLAFNKGRTYLLGIESSMYLRAYPWTDAILSQNSNSSPNIGTPLEATSQGTGWARGDWHPSDTLVIVGKGSSTAGLRAISFSSGWGTTLSDATSPMANLTGVKVSPSGKTVFICGTDSPYIEAYAFNSLTGFGSKFSNPSSLPPGPCYDLSVGKTNDVVAVASTSSPYVAVYPWNDATGFGTKFSAPSSIPPASSYALAFM